MSARHLQIAIVGDLHGQWDGLDEEILTLLAPDAVLVVGDLGEGNDRISRAIGALGDHAACVLGNHDAARDASGTTLQRQLTLLGDVHCGWGRRLLRPSGLAVVGGRPASPGGGHCISAAVRAIWGDVAAQDSMARIVKAAAGVPTGTPLVLLAHAGPTGLGGQAHDPCGRDWRRPAVDWGDQDLAHAIHAIRRRRPVPLVVFGHMHHRLRHAARQRISFVRDHCGTAYLNAAAVPRHCHHPRHGELRHFAWAELYGDLLISASQRWYGRRGTLVYCEELHRVEASGREPDHGIASKLWAPRRLAALA
ncbi:MAG: TIGR04168 family protein [Aphanocapsa feldmannii 277cV]|uniref:TIGR04168 family protein n=1 Tax=Aphanocapsa feldmannii 277cV TaxID=2507553 RepID=A0A524RQ84_9CHRO|nr:MAG: TIGR04168 family protein [Aphanocapsa feldmannii 277cV]